MENHITNQGSVLNSRGEITAGYSTSSVLTYRRRDIKAPFYRIKEWDFYQISDKEKCLQFTFGHASYAGQVGIMLFDYKNGHMIADKSKILAFPFSSLNLPENAEADSDAIYHKGGVYLRFQVKGDRRLLKYACKDFEAEVILQRKTPKSIVINIPFDEYKTAFYYNHKINCMTAKGTALFNGKEYTFDKDAYGLLDWGRGVWPFHNEWYWANGTGMLGDEMFGFNLGCGFGNTSAASENILFYKGNTHKIGKVHFDLGADYMKPWHFYDEDNRLDLTLYPMYDRTTKTKLAFVDNSCHQIFGEFRGRAVLDDGTELEISDIYAFSEHAINNW